MKCSKCGSETMTKPRPRKFEMIVDECVSCPAHHCIFKFVDKQKCLCEIKDRTIPQQITIGFGFPKWCPLEKLKDGEK